jgi:hypothetical protein
VMRVAASVDGRGYGRGLGSRCQTSSQSRIKLRSVLSSDAPSPSNISEYALEGIRKLPRRSPERFCRTFATSSTVVYGLERAPSRGK